MTSPLPTRVLAGITVPDTPLITKALSFAREHCDDFTYNHVLRSWLFGHYIASQTQTQTPSSPPLDQELHAITAILHDLGWSDTPSLITPDKRFEIDGADATREFLIREGLSSEWDEHRLQLAWDAVALHTTHSIAIYKEPEVRACAVGVRADFAGPEDKVGGMEGLGRAVWEGVVREYPRLGFSEGIKVKICGLCRTKPETTYDNFTAHLGLKYVEGYSLEGKTILDALDAAEQ